MSRDMRVTSHSWGQRAAVVVAIVCACALPGLAQPKGKKGNKPAPVETKPADPKPADKKATPPVNAKKEQNFNFTGLDITGKNRSPQLLYFLERANEELERASLEKRSFIPHLVRSVEEEPL